MWFMHNAMAKPDNAGAGATDYMHLFGLVALGYMWCKIAEAALRLAPKANGLAPRMNGKLINRAFFHGAHAAGNRGAARAHPVGRGKHDGIAGRGVLAERNCRIFLSPAVLGRGQAGCMCGRKIVHSSDRGGDTEHRRLPCGILLYPSS